MKNRMIGIGVACLMVLAVAACNGESRPPQAQTAQPPLGKFEEGMPEDAVIRLYLTADGTMIRAEGKRGGNWEKQYVFAGEPDSLGKALADIRIWEHDGTETGLGSNDGPSEHAHSGPANPPWDGHCHRWVRIGTRYILVHCEGN